MMNVILDAFISEFPHSYESEVEEAIDISSLKKQVKNRLEQRIEKKKRKDSIVNYVDGVIDFLLELLLSFNLISREEFLKRRVTAINFLAYGMLRSMLESIRLKDSAYDWGTQKKEYYNILRKSEEKRFSILEMGGDIRPIQTNIVVVCLIKALREKDNENLFYLVKKRKIRPMVEEGELSDYIDIWQLPGRKLKISETTSKNVSLKEKRIILEQRNFIPDNEAIYRAMKECLRDELGLTDLHYKNLKIVFPEREQRAIEKIYYSDTSNRVSRYLYYLYTIRLFGPIVTKKRDFIWAPLIVINEGTLPDNKGRVNNFIFDCIQQKKGGKEFLQNLDESMSKKITIQETASESIIVQISDELHLNYSTNKVVLKTEKINEVLNAEENDFGQGMFAMIDYLKGCKDRRPYSEEIVQALNQITGKKYTAKKFYKIKSEFNNRCKELVGKTYITDARGYKGYKLK